MSEYECEECGEDVRYPEILRNYETKVCAVCYTPEPQT